MLDYPDTYFSFSMFYFQQFGIPAGTDQTSVKSILSREDMLLVLDNILKEKGLTYEVTPYFTNKTVYSLPNRTLIIYCNNEEKDNHSFSFYYPESPEVVNSIIEKLKEINKQYDKKNKLYTLENARHGMDVTPNKIKKKVTDLGINYNDELLTKVPDIIADMNMEKPGLYLFHGIPGTGKSSFINYLIHNVDKMFIFIPNYITQELDSPTFIKILQEHPNSILILEDAEKILSSRDKSGNPLISTLLNLSDGLLGDCLNLQFICTMNGKIADLDTAVLRKGRLLHSIEFKPLEIAKVITLCDSLGYKDYEVKEMTLADIYCLESDHGHKKLERPILGFKK